MSEKKDFSDIGEKIRDALQDAADTGDFGQINFIVNDTVNSAMEEVRRQVNQVHDRLYKSGWEKNVTDQGEWREVSEKGGEGAGAYSADHEAGKRMPYGGTDYAARYRNVKTKGSAKSTAGTNTAGSSWSSGTRYSSQRTGQPQVVYRSRSGSTTAPAGRQSNLPSRYFQKKGSVASVLYIVFGSIGLGIFGLWTLILLLVTAVAGISEGAALTVLGLLTAASSVMLGKGCTMQARLKRAERYMKLLKDKMFMEVEDLAARAGLSLRKVKKDLRLMLKNGTFPEGHMDKKETVLVLEDELWDQYLTTQKNWENKKRLEQEKAAEQEGTAAGADITAEQQIEKEGRAYMQRLRKLNDEIPGEVISGKLFALDDLLQKIFDVLREHPEKSPLMRKFMDYYLPTTVKLMEAYADFDRSGVQSDDVKNAKAEIEKTMDTINQAFEKLLSDMYQDAAFEAAADARVLKTILAQDGYARSEFEVES